MPFSVRFVAGINAHRLSSERGINAKKRVAKGQTLVVAVIRFCLGEIAAVAMKSGYFYNAVLKNMDYEIYLLKYQL